MVTFCWAAATLSSGAGAAGEAGGKCRFMLTGGGQRAVGQLREGGMRARSKFAFKSGVNYNRPGFTQRRVLQAAPSLKSNRESTHIIPIRCLGTLGLRSLAMFLLIANSCCVLNVISPRKVPLW